MREQLVAISAANPDPMHPLRTFGQLGEGRDWCRRNNDIPGLKLVRATTTYAIVFDPNGQREKMAGRAKEAAQ